MSNASKRKIREDLFFAIAKGLDVGPFSLIVEADKIGGYPSGEPILFFRDGVGTFNSVQVIPYLWPHADDPRAPRLPRVHINHYSVYNERDLRERLGCTPGPHLKAELTVLPGEIEACGLWLAAIVRVIDGSSPMPLPRPPFRCHFTQPLSLLGLDFSVPGISDMTGLKGPEIFFNYLWSVEAQRKYDAHRGTQNSKLPIYRSDFPLREPIGTEPDAYPLGLDEVAVPPIDAGRIRS